jgi:hypothetical protein
LRSRIDSLALALAVAAALAAPAFATEPSVADLDARSRAEGNRVELAVHVGDRLFTNEWPVQVLKVEANGLGQQVVVGLMLSGVKFHDPITKAQFTREVADLAARTFAASPEIGEVDVWAVVPIRVKKGEIVSGDLAHPTNRNVFTVTVLRGESPQELLARMNDERIAFWDQEWERAAFKKGP